MPEIKVRISTLLGGETNTVNPSSDWVTLVYVIRMVGIFQLTGRLTIVQWNSANIKER